MSFETNLADKNSFIIMRSSAAAILATAFFCFSLNTAEAVESSELIRASVIEKIARFIEWPTWTDKQFTLCAADKTALLPALQTYYVSSSLANKPVNLLAFQHLKELTNCQVIYLGEDENSYLTDILQMTRNHPILIITEKKADVSLGVHVDFFVEDNRLHLEVNRTALLNSGLKASYHLLGVAHLVE